MSILCNIFPFIIFRQYTPYAVAFDDDTFAIIWEGNNADGDNRGICLQYFFKDCTVNGAKKIVNFYQTGKYFPNY